VRSVSLIVSLVMALSACEPKIVNDGADSRGNVEDRGDRAAPGTATDIETLVSNASKAIDSAPAAQPVISPNNRPDTTAEPEQTQTDEGRLDRAGISDEQDFEAVSNRETIQSDAERIQENRSRYRVVQPADLPARPGNLGPNVVDYALATDNPVGVPLYPRVLVLAESRFNRNCARYVSSDLAQRDFLAKGGPERDLMGLDPDGDGYACYWDPAPFRAALRAASGN